jgi:phage gpG-like protein
MADGASINYSTLQYVIGIYQERGRRAMQELAPAIADSMHAEVMEVFETEGYGTWPGFAWQRSSVYGPAKKPSTKGKRGRRWRGTPKLLQDTGNLAGSMTSAYDADMVEVFTNVRYAKFHVTGTRHMPKRDPFGIDREAFEADVADMVLFRVARDPIAAE